jgi:hypothetical protein
MFHCHAHAGMAMSTGTRDPTACLIGRPPGVEILEGKKAE